MPNAFNYKWKYVAERLRSKLNAIAFELDHVVKTSVSADCSILARDLMDKFSLEPNGEFLRPDFDDIVKVNDKLGSMLARLKFCTPSERDMLLDDVLKFHSTLNDYIRIYGAFL